MVEHLDRMLEIGAGTYIEGKIADIIDIAKISDPIMIGDKEYRLLAWIGIGEYSRWHSIMIEDCHFDDATTTIKFRYNDHNWGISSLQGLPAYSVEFYKTWRKKFTDITEYRLSQIDEIMKDEYDILLSRISPK